MPRVSAVHFNNDAVDVNVNKDLGFSEQDRIEQAQRMGWLCEQVVAAGYSAVADFICPTLETREAFTRSGDAFVIWIDRISAGRFDDTNQIVSAPDQYDVRVTADGMPEYRGGAGRQTIARCRNQRPPALERHLR